MRVQNMMATAVGDWKIKCSDQRNGPWVVEWDKQSFCGNAASGQIAPALVVPGEWQCQEATVLATLQRVMVKKKALTNQQRFFSQGSNLCLAWGSTDHFPLSPPPPKALSRRIRNHRAMLRGELRFLVRRRLFSEALPGADGRAARQPWIPSNLGEMAGCAHWGNYRLLLSPRSIY